MPTLAVGDLVTVGRSKRVCRVVDLWSHQRNPTGPPEELAQVCPVDGYTPTSYPVGRVRRLPEAGQG